MSDLRVPSLNTVTIAGRLTRDPELRYTAGNPGTAVCNLSIANTRYYKGKDGNRAEETCFVDVTVWGDAAERAGKLRKGRPVIVEGSIKQDTWKDKDTGAARSKLLLKAFSMTPLDWDSEGEEAPPPREDDVEF